MTTPSLLQRVLELLPPDRPVREVAMFGGRSIMLDDRMVVAVRGDRNLLVRIDPVRSAELLSLDGAQQAAMGAGRTMGPGWITVSADALTTASKLRFWMTVALEHHTAQSG